MLIVSIHARTRRATMWPCRAKITLRFQSTPARGGRPDRASKLAAIGRCFNPRPHAAGDDAIAGTCMTLSRGFNPRPHAAGDGQHPKSRMIAKLHCNIREPNTIGTSSPFCFSNNFI